MKLYLGSAVSLLCSPASLLFRYTVPVRRFRFIPLFPSGLLNLLISCFLAPGLAPLLTFPSSLFPHHVLAGVHLLTLASVFSPHVYID
eukprot:2258148-Pleurochrysis_carterae.AAC.1